LSDFPKVGSCTSFNYRVRNPVEALPGFEGPASAYPLLALWLLSGRQKRFIFEVSLCARSREKKEARSSKTETKNKRDIHRRSEAWKNGGQEECFEERERISRMSGVGRKKGILEVFKFATYVTIPIVMMSMFANNTENLDRIIRNRAYVVYPPEGPRPPSGDEIREMVKKNKTVS